MSEQSDVQSDARSTLSIVVPCYNEADSIPLLHSELTKIWPEFTKLYETELILVDDGSSDNTAELLKAAFAEYTNFQVVRHEVNQNLGAALRTGFAASKSDFVVPLDADCTTPMVVIPRMLARLENGADLVTASPYHPEGALKGVPVIRQIPSKGLVMILKLLLGSKNYTYTVMVRAYRREVVDEVPIRYNNFVAMTQIFCEAILKGFRVEDEPAILSTREFGASKMQTGRTIVVQLRFLSTILWPVFRKRILRRPNQISR
jgi:dolichol-phosphate mannosyltransferase